MMWKYAIIGSDYAKWKYSIIGSDNGLVMKKLYG